MSNFRSVRDRYETTDNYGMIMRAHRLSIARWGDYCAVPSSLDCYECVLEGIHRENRKEREECRVDPELWDARDAVVHAYQRDRFEGIGKSAEFTPTLNSPTRESESGNVYRCLFQVEQEISSLKSLLFASRQQCQILRDELGRVRTDLEKRVSELERKEFRKEHSKFRIDKDAEKRRKIMDTAKKGSPPTGA